MFVDLSDMLRVLDREMVLRRNVYRKRLAEGRMRLEEAAREYAVMQAVRKCISDLREGGVVVAEYVDDAAILRMLSDEAA
jgi:hypothetical protein